jgi:hypothetical protein
MELEEIITEPTRIISHETAVSSASSINPRTVQPNNGDNNEICMLSIQDVLGYTSLDNITKIPVYLKSDVSSFIEALSSFDIFVEFNSVFDMENELNIISSKCGVFGELMVILNSGSHITKLLRKHVTNLKLHNHEPTKLELSLFRSNKLPPNGNHMALSFCCMSVYLTQIVEKYFPTERTISKINHHINIGENNLFVHITVILFIFRQG